MILKYTILLLLYDIFIIFGQISTSPKLQPNILDIKDNNNCCNYINSPLLLMKCTNISINLNMNNILNNFYNGGGPSLGIGIVTFSTKDIFNYTSYAIAVNSIYAEHNGYIFKHLDPSMANYELRDVRWSKVKILEDALDPINGWAKDLNYVMWIDADLIFLDMGMRIEKITSLYPNSDIFISAEHAGSTTLVNSGSVIVKNSKFSRTFLNDWWNFADRKLFSDQEQFDMLYKSKQSELSNKYTNKFIILPPDAINTDPPAMTKQKNFNQVLHLMGEHTPYRAKVFKSAYQEICRFINNNINNNNNNNNENNNMKIFNEYIKSLSSSVLSNTFNIHNNNIHNSNNNLLFPQLNVTRENLLKWTIETYKEESMLLMNKYKEKVSTGMNELKESRMLSNSIHHYVHAILNNKENNNNDNNIEIHNKLRKTVFSLLYKNMKNRRKKLINKFKSNGNNINNIKMGQLDSNWPESLKVIAEAGQHLLQIGEINEKRKISDKIMLLLEEMFNGCHHDQRSSVMHMIAHLYREKGVIDMADNQIDNSLINFKEDLRINRELALISGNHILVTPLYTLANTYFMNDQFDQGFILYKELILLAEIHVGVNHESISQHLLNLGIAYIQTGKYNKAKIELTRAIQILNHNNIYKSNLRDKINNYLVSANNKQGSLSKYRNEHDEL
jgi:tetratricopeptide (TPR) repeat protein